MVDENDKNQIRELNKKQRRVLGVLVEKAFTTPEYYPLTIKALTTGCNQKSNRDPVINYTEDDVLETVEELKVLGLAATVHTESGRSERVRHYIRKKFDFSEPQLGIVTELLLRGCQQMGELRSRVSRMVPIDSQESLRRELSGLIEMKFVVSSDRLDKRGIEIDHAFYTSAEQKRKSVQFASPSSSNVELPVPEAEAHKEESHQTDHGTAIDDLKNRLLTLNDENRHLRAEIDEIRMEVQSLANEVQDLKTQLGV